MTEICKDERALLVVANLELGSSGGGDYSKLYEWLDKYAVLVANMLVGEAYRVVDCLSKHDVTLDGFLNHLATLAGDPVIKALDVLLVMHGSTGELHFDDRSIRTAALNARMKAACPADRLRLLYSTACYGASHAEDFLKAGFRTASGAKAVCANGPYDFPTQLVKWSSGQTYKSAVIAGNSWVFRGIYDQAARMMGFSDIDSEKVIVGRKYIRITSPVA